MGLLGPQQWGRWSAIPVCAAVATSSMSDSAAEALSAAAEIPWRSACRGTASRREYTTRSETPPHKLPHPTVR